MDNNLNQGESHNNKPQTPPNNYLILSIIATIVCFPFGIVGILNSSKVDGLYARGDYEAARNLSLKAKRWSRIGIIVSGICMTIYIIFLIYALITATSSIY